jgi:FkbM family methyltransferase
MKFLGTNILRVARRVERAAALVQGKGYLSPSVNHEVGTVAGFLKGEPRLAIDIGGNVGDYTAELRRSAPRLEVHVFEPSGANVRRLGERFRGDELVKVVPLAVSDESSVATLHSNEDGSEMASLAKRRLDHFGIRFDVAEEVRTIRFEEYWIGRLQRRVLDIVKVDIEGHELSALRGFGDALAATRVMQFEFGGTSIDTRTYWQDFWYFFTEQGFDLHRITPLGAQPLPKYRETDEYFSFVANFIAVNTRLVQ